LAIVDVERNAELIHHSDQGVQCACGDYIARLERARHSADP
jgi:hypothetical protein